MAKIRIRLDGLELARVRFAISPVYETVNAINVLRSPGAHAVHLPWVTRVRPLLSQVPDLPLLAALMAGDRKPAFLMPPPDDRLPDLATELRRIRATPRDKVRERTKGHTDDPTRLAAAIGAAFETLISRYWPRMRRLLEADIAHRAGILADRGIGAVFADLHPDLSWVDGELILWPRLSDSHAKRVTLTGHGLVLCPSVFNWPRIGAALAPVGVGTLRYPARGIAALWEDTGPGADALGALIGRTRASMLELLAEPATTSALAARLAVTAGAVSQHLAVLRESGLVATRRDGRSVLHLRTARADTLLG